MDPFAKPNSDDWPDLYGSTKRCESTSTLYTLHGDDIRCRRVAGHPFSHNADVSPDSADRNIVSWHQPVNPFAKPDPHQEIMGSLTGLHRRLDRIEEKLRGV